MAESSGLSCDNILTSDDLQIMASARIDFAKTNPDPEIAPAQALPHCCILATRRSDYPNQVNNRLAFRGALTCARAINESMKLADALAIAVAISENHRTEDFFVPSVFEKRVVHAVAQAVATAAHDSSVARRREREVH